MGARVESHIRVGGKFDVTGVAKSVVEGASQHGSVAVVLCRPDTIANEVSIAVCEFGRRGNGEVKFVEKRYGF